MYICLLLHVFDSARPTRFPTGVPHTGTLFALSPAGTSHQSFCSSVGNNTPTFRWVGQWVVNQESGSNHHGFCPPHPWQPVWLDWGDKHNDLHEEVIHGHIWFRTTRGAPSRHSPYCHSRGFSSRASWFLAAWCSPGDHSSSVSWETSWATGGSDGQVDVRSFSLGFRHANRTACPHALRTCSCCLLRLYETWTFVSTAWTNSWLSPVSTAAAHSHSWTPGLKQSFFLGCLYTYFIYILYFTLTQATQNLWWMW